MSREHAADRPAPRVVGGGGMQEQISTWRVEGNPPARGTELLRVDAGRLLERIEALAEVGAIDGGGCRRLALTDEDRVGRDLVVSWMRELDLDVRVDSIGNVVGTRPGRENLAPVMCGSHIDTVATGGRYDGNLGVLAGLEVVETLADAGVVNRRPLAVAFFTDEEGSRFAPDMLGSLVYAGGMQLEEAHDVMGIDGARVGDELARIGYLGAHPCPGLAPHAFVELHIEQGPVLEAHKTTIGAVEGVQGISWQELTIVGQSNHATTPATAPPSSPPGCETSPPRSGTVRSAPSASSICIQTSSMWWPPRRRWPSIFATHTRRPSRRLSGAWWPLARRWPAGRVLR